MTSFRGAPLRHCEAELFRSRWIRFFGRTAFGAAIQIYRYIGGVRLMRPLLLRLVLFLWPFIAARTCLLIGARTSPSLPKRRTPEKEEAREKGAHGPWRRFGSSASEGGSPARYGDALDRRGLAIRRCELPRICYRLSTLHLFRRMSASRKQLAKRPRLKLGFG